MEEKRKELMQLIISMTDEEHLDSLLEVARVRRPLRLFGLLLGLFFLNLL